MLVPGFYLFLEAYLATAYTVYTYMNVHRLHKTALAGTLSQVNNITTFTLSVFTWHLTLLMYELIRVKITTLLENKLLRYFNNC